MALDLTALSAYTTEHAEEFFGTSVLKADTPQLMNVMVGMKPGTHKIPNWDHDYDLFQSGTSCGFNASGDFTIDQRSITVTSLKINTEYCIRELEAKFTRQILPAGQEYEGLDPISQGILSRLSMSVSKAMELSLWQGESGGSSGQAYLNLFDGLDKIITNETGNLAYEGATGPLSTSNIVGAVEELYENLPVDAFGGINGESDWVVLMGHDKAKMYARGYRDTYGANNNYTSFEKRFVDGTNIEIIGVAGLHGTDKLVLARKSNLILALDVEGEEQDFMVYMDQDQENVRIKARFALGVQINFPGEVAVDNY